MSTGLLILLVLLLLNVIHKVNNQAKYLMVQNLTVLIYLAGFMSR